MASDRHARPRARDAGIVIGTMQPGQDNAITDVPGVGVGHVTLVSGQGALIPGSGPVRTGVTAILPHPGNLFRAKVPAAIHVINGFGKSTGLAQVAELGNIETPIVLTNTLSVGTAWDAVVTHMIGDNPDIGVGTVGTVNPVIGECNDGYLNDIQGRHVRADHVLQALDAARGGPVAEGCVGAGTGMSAFGFKGGIGTASRILPEALGGFAVGVLVLANFGRRVDLVIDGVPVGLRLADWQPAAKIDVGSVMVVMATNAPASDRQLGRLARRGAHGLSRTGSIAGHGSGDFAIAFATEGLLPAEGDSLVNSSLRLAEDGALLGGLFQAVIEATEEAVINALFAAETTVGRDDHVRYALPVDVVQELMATHGRLKR